MLIRYVPSIFILLLCYSFVGCDSNEDNPPADVNNLEIRIRNVSDYDYDNIRVNTSGNDKLYGDLTPGENSTYLEHEMAYAYAFVELEIDGDTFTIQPIDYVGETPLEDGKYTYEISASDSNERYGRLNILLVED